MVLLLVVKRKHSKKAIVETEGGMFFLFKVYTVLSIFMRQVVFCCSCREKSLRKALLSRPRDRLMHLSICVSSSFSVGLSFQARCSVTAPGPPYHSRVGGCLLKQNKFNKNSLGLCVPPGGQIEVVQVDGKRQLIWGDFFFLPSL